MISHKHTAFYGSIIVAIVVASIGTYMILSSIKKEPILEENEAIACTMEVKQCSDGSYVGRQGPNCDFAVCPVFTTIISTTSSNQDSLPRPY